jgi:hypothetical protein
MCHRSSVFTPAMPSPLLFPLLIEHMYRHCFAYCHERVGVVSYTMGIPLVLYLLGRHKWSTKGDTWQQSSSIMGSVIESYKPRFW